MDFMWSKLNSRFPLFFCLFSIRTLMVPDVSLADKYREKSEERLEDFLIHQ